MHVTAGVADRVVGWRSSSPPSIVCSDPKCSFRVTALKLACVCAVHLMMDATNGEFTVCTYLQMTGHEMLWSTASDLRVYKCVMAR